MRTWVYLALAGCTFHRGAARIDDALSGDDVAVPDGSPTQDAPRDAPGQSDAPLDALLCTGAGLVCPTGTVMALTCNSACWVSCTEMLDEPTAASRCATWGGHLAPILSQADEDCVHLATGVFGAVVASWTGYEQAAAATSVAGGWGWNGGFSSAFTSWSGGQPNDADGTENGEEQCAYVSSPSGNWQDTPCTTTFKYSCRR